MNKMTEKIYLQLAAPTEEDFRSRYTFSHILSIFVSSVFLIV